MGLFGEPLPLDGPVPEIFEICLSHLELHALESEGIFRISGQKIRVDQIKQELEEGRRYEFYSTDDINDVAGVFRLWLQSLPEPIIPYSFYNKMVACGRLKGKKAQAELKVLVSELPPLRATMLQKLIRLLRLFSLYSEVNKMNANNLSVVMAPNICRSDSQVALTPDILVQSQCITNAVIELIDGYEEILPKEVSSDAAYQKFKRNSRIMDPKLIQEAMSIQIAAAEEAAETQSTISEQEASNSPAGNSSKLGPPVAKRSRGASTPRNRGFSNALDWLITMQQSDALDEIAAVEEPEEEEVITPRSKKSKKSKTMSASTTDVPDVNLSIQSEVSPDVGKKLRRSNGSKSMSSSTTDMPEISVNLSNLEKSPKKSKSKRSASESVSEVGELTAESESPSTTPRSSSSSSSKRKKSHHLPLPSIDASSEDLPKSPRSRKISPPSRNTSTSSEKGE